VIRGLRLFVAATILAVCLGATAGTVYTSSIGVTAPLVYSKSHTIAIGELVPANCSPIAASIDSIANGASSSALWGTLGGGSNTVWLWNAQNQTTTSGGGALNGGNGADCMVPGGVRSGVTLTVGGGKGADYCYTGPGPGGYAGNSCNNASLFGTPYVTVTTSSPAFA
jgi:hypothetical protein